jgi:hypothetical protein
MVWLWPFCLSACLFFHALLFVRTSKLFSVYKMEYSGVEHHTDMLNVMYNRIFHGKKGERGRGICQLPLQTPK